MLRRILIVSLGLAAVLLALAGPWLIGRMAESRLEATARARGLTAEWRRSAGGWPARVRFERLLLRTATNDTLLLADSVLLSIDPGSILLLRPRAQSVTLAGASIRILSGRSDMDTVLV